MGSYWSKDSPPTDTPLPPQLPFGFEDEIKEIVSFVPVVDDGNSNSPKVNGGGLPCRKCFYRTKKHEIILEKASEAYENSVVEFKFAVVNHERAKEVLAETRKDLKSATDRHHKSLSEVGVKSVLTRRQCRLATEAVKRAKQNVEFMGNRERRKEKAVTNLEKLRDLAKLKLDVARDKEKSCLTNK
jgi:hypothetical protein